MSLSTDQISSLSRLSCALPSLPPRQHADLICAGSRHHSSSPAERTPHSAANEEQASLEVDASPMDLIIYPHRIVRRNGRNTGVRGLVG